MKLGATKDGKLVAGQYTFLIDSGAYTDQAAGITRAMALDCTGLMTFQMYGAIPTRMQTPTILLQRLSGDTAIPECTGRERTMDQLAKKLNMDPIELRSIKCN